MKIDFAALKFNVHGYINAIVQDAGTDEVLALAKMDGEALVRTAENGRQLALFLSRSLTTLPFTQNAMPPFKGFPFLV